MKTALLYNTKFGEFDYGQGHPMRPLRLKETFELIKEVGLLNLPDAALIEARRASDAEILTFHTPEYLEVLKRADSGGKDITEDDKAFNIGQGDCPAFPGVFEWSSYSAGASVQGAELILSGEADIAFNIAGGLHHAMAERASGFCYINDAVLAIKHLLNAGKRVVYVDIDAHHGDGVEAAFVDTDQVLTISIHENGFYLFPGTGFVENIGTGAGKGFAINVPLLPGADDNVFVDSFEAIVPAFIEAFKPDVLVTQLGVDSFTTDPLTHMSITTNGFSEMIERFRSLNLPWLALGGGGYNLDNVKRAWTLAWAIMNGVEVPDALHDPTQKTAPPEIEKIKATATKTIDFLIDKVLPIVKG
ncbi:MAG: acetoin utilization protein AcuC [Deltaproteobacteria bacterium]|nr:acetoin utilization protein AcuC [Deltaproteobacteria bacterium]